jgi:hypothetical protein
MTGKRSDDPSPEQTARANRRRIAAEEGVQAMVDVEKRAAAVRKNMERLRALREAKEAELVGQDDAPIAAKAAKKRKTKSSA